MDSAKNQLAEKINGANNILVTVSRNPSVDQLAALLGLTLAINKIGKHAAAVFSGEVPSTLEFLQPEATFEKNTDSLRDFIIALDKSKADKLRYKVEDDVVRIFITPYKTSISDADLEFSQGDFNVDVVVAIGVQQQEDLDEAITAHGRILHDATVTSINTLNGQSEGLGSINWHDDQSSSLSELATELIQSIDPTLFDEQISTALLTGIVAETERFSNEKTSAQTMSMSALLMGAGANQQLVATKLNEPAPEPEPEHTEDNAEEQGDNANDSNDADDSDEQPKNDDGSLEIDHEHDADEKHDDNSNDSHDEESTSEDSDENSNNESNNESNEEHHDDSEGNNDSENHDEEAEAPKENEPGKFVTEPPELGGQLTANSEPEALDPSTDPMSLETKSKRQLLKRNNDEPAATPDPEPTPDPKPAAEELTPVLTPPPADWTDPDTDTQSNESDTLTDLEAAVVAPETPDVGDARDEVSKALSSDAAVNPPTAIEALNAQPFGDILHPAEVPQAPEANAPASSSEYTSVEELLGTSESTDLPAMQPFQPLAGPAIPIPDDIVVQQTPAGLTDANADANAAGPFAIAPPTDQPQPVQDAQVFDPTAPPPVPPPIPFQFGQPPANPPQNQ